MLKGSCLCGRVTFEIRGALHSARYCHCANCRKFSGTAYAAWAIARADDLRVASSSQSNVSRYDSGGGLRAFCRTCGSPLWYEPAALPAYRGVPLGAIDRGDVSAPEMHVWIKSKLPWMTIGDELPQHETHP